MGVFALSWFSSFIQQGGFDCDQTDFGRFGPNGRFSLCGGAGAGRLALRAGTMRLGPPSCGRGTSLCGYLGGPRGSQLFLETWHLRPLENDLSVEARHTNKGAKNCRGRSLYNLLRGE